MTNSLYWPLAAEVRNCIKTEAEELADSTLMAVHEPMQLRQVAAGYAKGELVSEKDLLDHLIATNRPTPILGQSGFGKSHVIRWLDVQLRRRKDSKNWHIVRIAKNASLKQALTSLLDGLRGSEFEDARRRIDSVGRGLKTRTVAKHLVVYVGAQLEELYDKAELQLANAQAQGLELDADERQRIKVIRRHAKPVGLSKLIGDEFFNKQLIEEGKCFYQIAKRFTEGSSDQEIEEGNYQVKASDLEMSAALGDMSLDARTYVRNAQLNTSEEARSEAVALLNECLGDASREAFQQLFQFHSGSFQDLFQDIRRYLLAKGKTLFILVEDMATISAIEDVLIDSLMQEDVREGKQVLCALHSAIAVTTGYQGYTRRKDTLKTRAKYEWYTDRQFESEEETYDRIANFCGRYLNAARHGEKTLVDSFEGSEKQKDWPGTWKSDDERDEHLAAVFGSSSMGFPLFPYNDHALIALANRYCRPHETVEFNPRKILQHILREPLERFRSAYVEGQYPPAGFANIQCPSALRGDLNLKVRDNGARAATVAAIWGHGAESIAELAHQLPAPIADEFGISALSAVLEGTQPSVPKGGYAQPRFVPTSTGGGRPGPIYVSPPVKEDAHAIPRQVDGFFTNRDIPQNVAREVRKVLLEAIEDPLRDFSDWYGLNGWPKLKVGNRPLIRIPYNPNNPERTIMEFGSEKVFSDDVESLRYKQFIVAVLRRKSELGDETQSWNYAGGVQDYCAYKNFLDDWLPKILADLVKHQREFVAQNIDKRLAALSVFEPRLSNCSATEKVNNLVLTSDQIRERINVKTGLADWDGILEKGLANWDQEQCGLLDAFSTNRHGIDGDLIRRALHGLSDVSIPTAAARAAQNARKEFVRQFSALQGLSGCTNREDYEQSLGRLGEFIAKLSAVGQFKNMEGVITARRLINKINKIIKSENWVVARCALSLQEPYSSVETIRALHGIDLDGVRDLNECLEIWVKYFETNLPRLLNENAEHGADKRKDIEDEFDGLMARIGQALQQAEGAVI